MKNANFQLARDIWKNSVIGTTEVIKRLHRDFEEEVVQSLANLPTRLPRTYRAILSEFSYEFPTTPVDKYGEPKRSAVNWLNPFPSEIKKALDEMYWATLSKTELQIRSSFIHNKTR